ncbi:MAG: hypothetical protein IKA74_02995 [Clostridia bacterium]|nr:hypothetical protein [Clostridia bacterium]
MKNKVVRLIALMLALIFCTLALAACKDDEDDGDDVKKIEGSGEAVFEGVSFEGKTVKMCLSNSSEASRGGTSSSKYIEAPDSEINDAIVRKAKERNDYVNGRLGIDIKYTYIDDAWDTAFDLVMNLFRANDENTPDVVSCRVTALFKLQLEGIFRNLNTEQFTNYFNFSYEDGWYTQPMNDYSFGQDMANGGKGFIMMGDFFLDIIRCASVLYVNEDLIKSKGFYTDVTDFYDFISDGEWTWEVLSSFANQAFHEQSGGQIGKDEYDDLGLLMMANGSKRTAAATAMTLAYGSTDMDLVYYENGQYRFNETNINGIFANYCRLLKESLFDLNGGYLHVVDTEDTNVLRRIFARGRTLFCGNLYLYDLEGSTLSGMSICPIPYPKLDESDDYMVKVYDTACAGSILKNSREFTPASAYIQYMSIKSPDVRTTYYEKGLGLKYETGTNTKQMLDLIYNSLNINPTQQLDMAITAASGSENAYPYLYSILGSVVAGNSEVGSSWASIRDLKITGLSNLCQKYSNLPND